MTSTADITLAYPVFADQAKLRDRAKASELFRAEPVSKASVRVPGKIVSADGWGTPPVSLLICFPDLIEAVDGRPNTAKHYLCQGFRKILNVIDQSPANGSVERRLAARSGKSDRQGPSLPACSPSGS